MSTTFILPTSHWPPIKRRRTATTVLAGDFDPRPPRDVLTSLLNGVGPYRAVEHTDEERRLKKLQRRAREKERIRQKKAARAAKDRGAEKIGPVAPRASSMSGASAIAALVGNSSRTTPVVNTSTSSFWRSAGLPPAPTRSVSPSPPPESYSPPTPGPSVTSTISRTSSKRPHTPDDGMSIDLIRLQASPSPPPTPKPRKKRQAARKGWKGWVEGSPPPSNKLINLDHAPVMRERRLRSGKNFDAISEGTERWVDPEH